MLEPCSKDERKYIEYLIEKYLSDEVVERGKT